jgi:hypothetical protein
MAHLLRYLVTPSYIVMRSLDQGRRAGLVSVLGVAAYLSSSVSGSCRHAPSRRRMSPSRPGRCGGCFSTASS